MNKPLDIDQSFDRFMTAAYGEVSATQYDESRKVWYASMHQLLCHMLTFGADVAGGDAELERLFKETSAFGEIHAGQKR